MHTQQTCKHTHTNTRTSTLSTLFPPTYLPTLQDITKDPCAEVGDWGAGSDGAESLRKCQFSMSLAVPQMIKKAIGKCSSTVALLRVGHNHISIYVRCIYGAFGMEITKYTVIYGVYVRIWPTLSITLAAKKRKWRV
jgi:hypothetical protein